MPIVGMETAFVTAFMTASGIHSRTMARIRRLFPSALSHHATKLTLDRLALAGLDLISAEHVDGLRGHPQVAHDRNLGAANRSNRGNDFFPPSILTASSAHLQHPAASFSHGLFRRHVIGQIRHVGHDQALCEFPFRDDPACDTRISSTVTGRVVG